MKDREQQMRKKIYEQRYVFIEILRLQIDKTHTHTHIETHHTVLKRIFFIYLFSWWQISMIKRTKHNWKTVASAETNNRQEKNKQTEENIFQE